MDDGASVSKGELLRRADALRDARRWEEAARGYAAYLRRDAWDRGARVQYGHCLKESGDLAAALAAYREAEAQAPEDADIALQIGHALKLLGDPEAAWRAYARALTLDPASEAAAREVSALAHVAETLRRVVTPPAAGTTLQVVFDASDLIEFFRGNRAPTGIQRVQLNIIVQALLDPPDDKVVAVVAFDSGAGFWRDIPRELFLRLWRLSRMGSRLDDPAWTAVIDDAIAAMRDGPDFAFASGAALVNLGTSWWIKDYFLRVRHAKRRYGIRYIPFIHDCIPLIVPEHCERGLVQEFAQWFSELGLHADAAFANSDCTAADAARVLETLIPGLQLPFAVVRLDASLRQDLAGASSALPHPGIPESGRPFVLCVGTIESRKNHLLLFQAWLALIRRHGAGRVPLLVCVGKPGWLSDPAMTLLHAAPELDGAVRILHGIPDVDLARLYERSLFTVYGSHYEGWGLPVTESLSCGKVPVVPHHSGLVESGAGGALFFEHQNLPDFMAKLEAMLFEPGFRAAREAAIAGGAHLRTWPQLAAQILSDPILRDRTVARGAVDRATMREGEVLSPGLSGALRPSLGAGLAEGLRDGLFWHPLGEDGCWTRPGAARLRLALPPGTQGRLRVHLGLRAPAGGSHFGVRALPADGAAGAFTRVKAAPRAAVTVVLEADAVDGVIGVEIEAPPHSQRLPGRVATIRRVGVCVTHVMACRPDDTAARTAFLERQHFLLVEPG